MEIWSFIYVLKILIFILLALIFLLEIGRDSPVFHYLAMTSAVNINFYKCDVHKNHEGKERTIQECTNELIFMEWFVFVPILAFMLYMLYHVILVRGNIKRNLNKPDYEQVKPNYFKEQRGSLGKSTE